MEKKKEYPKHVAIILDGNRRWAKERGLTGLQGHKAGFDNIKRLSTYILDQGTEVLSVFAFSTENFNRSKEEVNYLMDLFVNKFRSEKKYYQDRNIRVVFSGRETSLRPDVLKVIRTLEEETKDNTGGIFNVCLNYGGRDDIIFGIKNLFKEIKENDFDLKDLNEETFKKYLYTKDMPDVDLLIRTSGEERISNFMLYQLAYAELIFTKTYWPDFDVNQLHECIDIFNSRTRRFGKI